MFVTFNTVNGGRVSLRSYAITYLFEPDTNETGIVYKIDGDKEVREIMVSHPIQEVVDAINMVERAGS